jgi:hypothetical protein
MMESARTSEMLVNFYQTTWHYNPEDSHLQIYFFLEICPRIILEYKRLQYYAFLLANALTDVVCLVGFINIVLELLGITN